MLVILGNQLFPLQYLPPADSTSVFMAEDVGLCTYEKHHQQKIVLFLAAMRAYADQLRAAGYCVRCQELDITDSRPFEDKLAADMKKLGDVIKSEIIEQVDHKNLNIDVPFMEGKLASCENLIKAFWDILYPEVKKLSKEATLYKLRLYETPKNFVDYFGEHG